MDRVDKKDDHILVYLSEVRNKPLALRIPFLTGLPKMTHLSLHLLYVNLMCFYLCCIRFRRVYLSPTTWPSDRISQWTTWSQQWSRCTTTTRPVRLPYEPVLHTHIGDTEVFVTSWPMKSFCIRWPGWGRVLLPLYEKASAGSVQNEGWLLAEFLTG